MGCVHTWGSVVSLVGVGEAVVGEAVPQARVRADADTVVVVVAGAEIQSVVGCILKDFSVFSYDIVNL